MNIITKKCSKCGNYKKLSEFGKNKRKKDGLQSWCKPCMSAVIDVWRKENKEREIETAKKWLKNNIDKYNATIDKWRKEHPEYGKKAAKEWRKNNPNRVKKQKKIWKKNNKDKCRLYSSKRRSEEKGVVSESEWLSLCKFYDNKCLRCGRDNVALTIDHIVPISHGGKNIIDNIQPLCKKCNCIKYTKHTDYRKKKM